MIAFRVLVKEIYRNMRIDSIHCSSNVCSGSYEEAIEALNTLQTNAQVLQKLKDRSRHCQENNVVSTIKYLCRSGVSLDQLERELSVIHVSGTKGKGSTCALCESILHCHGHKTGFFSSPHLVAVQERIRINGTPLSETDFAQYFWKVYSTLKIKKEHENDMPPYFKFLTVMALNVFLSEKVDVAIIEVGVGGELDCTNIFKKPAVVGITSLGLDHISLLGNTIEQIAWQKGGIMKPGTPAFTSPQPAQALEVLKQRAIEKNCPLTQVPPLSEYDCQDVQFSLGLKGDVQKINTSLAVQLSMAWIGRRQLAESSTGLLAHALPMKIDRTTAEGIKLCSWPGRFQVLTRKSDHGSCTYYLDGAHTLESIELCVQWFKQTINDTQIRGSCRNTLVFNVTGDRNAAKLLVPLMSCHFDSAFFCPNILVSNPVSNDSTNCTVTLKDQLDCCEANKNSWLLNLKKGYSGFGTELKTFPSVTETIQYIEKRRGEQRVLVTGSLHLLGAVLSAFGSHL